MGVRGLSTLVDENKDMLLNDHMLHDTRVIIDGSNLYHFLYYHYRVPVPYGGDYDHYARKCKHFFHTLRSCGVSPYIVLDGGYDPDDRKLSEVLQRMVSRRLRAGLICYKGRGCVLPILAYETFHQVLVELNVPHVSATYEADREIAVLAHRWKCPVLSNDSDFFIYGMSGGYIPLDYINMTLCLYNTRTNTASILETNQTAGENEFVYLPVKYYHYEYFTKSFRQNNSDFVLPMFATLNGNDYINPESLSNFLGEIRVPKNPSKKAFNLKAQTHILAILYWLDTMDTLDDALQNVLGHIRQERKDFMKKMLSRSIDDYRCIENFSSVEMDVFLDEMTSTSDDLSPIISLETNHKIPELLDYNSRPLPTSFVKDLRNCSLTSNFLQNVIVNHRTLFNCQIEILREISTFACSRDVRSVIYGIVTNVNSASEIDGATNNGAKSDTSMENSVEFGTTDEQSTADESASSSTKRSRVMAVEEYDREGKNTRKFYVEPAQSVRVHNHTYFLPTLNTLNESSPFKRKILFATFGVSASDELGKKADDVALLLIGVISWWVQKAEPKLFESHVNALLLGIVMLHVRSLNWLKMKRESGASPVRPNLIPSLAEAIESQPDEDVKRFVKHVEKHLVKPDQCSRSSRESKIIHGFSQFQACLLDAIYLNQVLQFPVNMPSPGVLLNCTFLYNLCRDLETRPKPDFYIAEILKINSDLHKLFVDWKDQILQLCKTNCTTGCCSAVDFFLVENRTNRKAKKKSKAKKSAKCSVKPSENLSSDDTDTPRESDRQSTAVNCDINNRFAMLCLDDD